MVYVVHVDIKLWTGVTYLIAKQTGLVSSFGSNETNSKLEPLLGQITILSSSSSSSNNWKKKHKTN